MIMSISGIHGRPLEVTVLILISPLLGLTYFAVVGCYNLEDNEWVSRQDPFVCLEYGSARFRTKTCTDGGKNPIFQEKIQLHKVLSQGFQDCTLPLQSKTGRHSGEVRLILHYPNAKQPQNWKTKGVPSLPEYAPCAPFKQLSPHAHPPAAPYPITMPYAAPPTSYNLYTHCTATYPPSPHVGYPPQAPPSSYTYPHHAYPPPPLPSTYYPPAPTGIYPPAPY
ncbi:hypothetical protein GQ457_07G025190 [Hibiscus cannabinus]